MPRWTIAAAVTELSARDPVLAELSERHGPPSLDGPVPVAARFEVLARAIAYQQLNGRAAGTIWGRVVELVGEPFTAIDVLARRPDELRACGLSGSKVVSLLDLAAHEADGRLGLASVGRLDDDAVVARLAGVRGIGPWTAHMFLMGALRRPDVWPTGDYGVRVGFGRAWLDGRTPDARELAVLGERFRPWRSVVAWYCWRAVEDPTYDR